MNRLLLLLALLLLSSCATRTDRGVMNPEPGIPAWGAPLPAGTWEKADARGEKPIAESDSVWWFLPFTLSGADAAWRGKDEVLISRGTYNDLLLPFFLVPLRFSYAQYLYKRPGLEPVAEQKLRWTPFWATAWRKDWPADRPVLRASGVPLVFGKASLTSPDGIRVGLWNSLWSLGPLGGWLDVPKTDSASSTAPQLAGGKGWMFMPVALGGLGGSILWLDLHLRLKEGPDAVRVDAHGPLQGLLGYVATDVIDRRSAEARERLKIRLFVGGLLWMDISSKPAGAEVASRAAHGPLWGMFGWGRKNSKPAVRFFWITIPV